MQVSSSLLREATEKLLNEQVAMEAQSSTNYLAMASWCDAKGYKHAAAFLYQHAEEERAHMLRLFHYINDVGGRALSPVVTRVKHEFASFKEVFTLVLDGELQVTKAIHRLVDHCTTHKDFATTQFLQWFVTEQVEEEALARRALELFELIGEDSIGQYTIDQEIGKLVRSKDA